MYIVGKIKLMKVKNKIAESSYGRKEVEASHVDCPCRSCFRIHNCKYTTGDGNWVDNYVCITNHNHGCPVEQSTPCHVFRGKGVVCLKCGHRRDGKT